ncbi:MAG: hypothetical protein EBY30_16425 [Rhodospirillales bacterium]|nr:hypothetical protein [Rhodospirillales bacterium]
MAAAPPSDLHQAVGAAAIQRWFQRYGIVDPARAASALAAAGGCIFGSSVQTLLMPEETPARPLDVFVPRLFLERALDAFLSDGPAWRLIESSRGCGDAFSRFVVSRLTLRAVGAEAPLHFYGTSCTHHALRRVADLGGAVYFDGLRLHWDTCEALGDLASLHVRPCAQAHSYDALAALTSRLKSAVHRGFRVPDADLRELCATVRAAGRAMGGAAAAAAAASWDELLCAFDRPCSAP